MSDERRRYVRKRVDLAGTLQIGEAPPVAVHVSDMCPGGAFIDVEENPAFGTKVILTVQLPKGRVAADGTIRWEKGAGVGLMFGLLGAAETYAITEYLAGLEDAEEA